MPNYTKTGPFVNASAPGISAAFLNNVENVFKQSSGGTETGTYWFSQGTYTTSAQVGVYIPTLSRGTAVVSVTIDTSILVATGLNPPSVLFSGPQGFFVGANGTGTSLTARVGGLWTVQY
jgi:hypothetical protein